MRKCNAESQKKVRKRLALKEAKIAFLVYSIYLLVMVISICNTCTVCVQCDDCLSNHIFPQSLRHLSAIMTSVCLLNNYVSISLCLFELKRLFVLCLLKNDVSIMSLS